MALHGGAPPLPVWSAAFGTNVGNVVGTRVGGLVPPRFVGAAGAFVGAAAPAQTIAFECRAVGIKVLSEVVESTQSQRPGKCARRRREGAPVVGTISIRLNVVHSDTVTEPEKRRSPATTSIVPLNPTIR